MAKKDLKEEKSSKTKNKKKNEVKEVVESKKKNVKKEMKETLKVEKVNEENVVDNELKTNLEPKKKNILGIVLTVLVILLIVVTFIISVVETNKKNKYYHTISFNEVSEIMDNEETQIIYWASPSCDFCKMFTPVIKEVSYEYQLDFNYLNTGSLTSDQYATMYTYFSSYDETYNSSNLGTPALILVKNNEVVNISVGYLDEAKLLSYLKENGLIEE